MPRQRVCLDCLIPLFFGQRILERIHVLVGNPFAANGGRGVCRTHASAARPRLMP